MTNNNWQQFLETQDFYKYGNINNTEHGTFSKFLKNIKDFISQELTKKDQEHKAELERIKGEIESFEVYDDEPDNCRRLKLNTVAILNSHINKLSTE